MTVPDRVEVGRALATALDAWRGRDAVVLGLQSGGVVVGAEVAAELGLPLDVLLVRPLATPSEPSAEVGVIGEGGVRVLDPVVFLRQKIRPGELARVEAAAQLDLVRRAALLRRGRRRRDLTGRVAIVVDDGDVSGATIRAACHVARRAGALGVVVAVPDAPTRVLDQLGGVADDVICLADRSPTTDSEDRCRVDEPVPDADVIQLLEAAERRIALTPPAAA